MTEVSPGTWNQTWLAYQQDDGPLWVEVIMETQDGFYSYNLTKVTIANSNPLALNPVSPASHDSVSGVVTLSAQVVNSTPISQVTCTIYDGNMMLPLDVMTLEPQGGDLYSAYWGSQGTYDGKYYFAFSVRDTFGAVAYNISSKVDISNPIHFEIQLLEPTSTLGWSPNASLIATTTGPFYTKSMDYTITQYYYDPDSRQYENIAVMDSGSMVDPDSTWIAEIDTSRYPKMVSVWDGWHWDHYVAYYQIEIIGKDTGYGTTRFSEYFTLGDAELVKASIIFPFDHMAVSNVFSVNVSTTSPADFFLYINGTVRDAHDNVVQELDFTNYGNTADAVVYSYAYPNGWYTIEAWGETTNGTFYDTVTVQFDNLIVFSVQFVNPPEGGTLTGDVTIQLQIYNATDLVHIWVDISEYEHGPQLVYLGSFDYNMTSGYWEETWASWELPDGNYYISCGAKDINDIEVYGESNFILNNPPNVTILEPAPASSFVEKENIHFVVRIPDTDVDHVELWAEGDYIMNFTKSVGENWTADWSDTMGYDGAVFIQVFAYDTSGLVNNTQWIGISISRVTPPAGHADIYEITTTNSTGGEQTTFSQGETVEYHSIIRGDAGNTTYVVTAQTNDPLLNGYLEYNETVTVTAGQDIEVVFNFNISAGAPTGTYTVQILVWTDWPWNGGICVDFITITFEVV